MMQRLGLDLVNRQCRLAGMCVLAIAIVRLAQLPAISRVSERNQQWE